MRHSSVVAAILLLLCLSARGQTPSVKTESKPGVGAEVDKIFEKWNRTDSPGCALSVMREGQIVYEHGYGMADLDHNVTITPTTVFHVASMSKQFTAAAVVLLAEQGKLSLDDDIRKYIPEVPDFGTPITIRELIHHASGLRDQWELLGLAGWRYSLDLITDDDVMSVLTRQRGLNFKPGEKYVYSNTNYTLLAQIVKRVSAMSLREFTTKNIFEPLGMKNTHFRDDHAEIVKNNAYGYEREKDDLPYRLGLTNFDTVGATSLHTTVEDLALWDENFYHPRIGGTGFVKQMLEQGKLDSGEQIDYAFGLGISKYKGLSIVEHGGTDAGYRAGMIRFPQQHFSSAVLCNTSEALPVVLIHRIADIYLAQEIEAATPQEKTARKAPESRAGGATVQLTQQQLSGMAGLYWDRDEDQFVKTYVKDGNLRIYFDTENDYDLRPDSERQFRLAGDPFGDSFGLKFEQSERGQSQRFSIGDEGDKPTLYELVETFTPDSATLTEYAGEYTSEEIDPVYRFVVQDGKLELIRAKFKPDMLEPRVRDTFSCSLGTIRFTREANGRISGFVIDSGRIRDFRFRRRRATQGP